MAYFNFSLNPPPARLAQSSSILHGFTNGAGPDYCVSGFRTPLSLKAVASGSAFYRTPRGHYRVTDDCFLCPPARPFEWDVKRLAASFVLAACWLHFSAADTREAVESMVASYRATMARFSEMTVLETWYAKIAEVEALKKFSIDPKALKLLLKNVDKATHNTSEHVFHKIVRVTDGKPRIADQPPLLSHGDPSEFTIEGDALPFFENYRATLSADRQALFDRFRLVDAANKVVGIGSVGTRCYIALFLGNQDDHLFLQVKEARPSVLEGLAGPSPCTNNGERVVTGQRLMQSASDIFLGWCRGTSGHDYYVRQLHDTKVAADLTGYTPRILTAYGRLCGRALARAHAKSGDAATIAGYLGANGVFDEAIAGYALAYADQVNKDYKSFRHAITIGRFPTETSPSASE